MGPSAYVIFEKKPSNEASMELEKVLHGLGLGLGLDFYFRYPDSEYWDYDDEALISIKEKTSLSIRGALVISCPCNGDEDHRNLGYAALIASKHLSGLVDFGGAITPELPASMSKGMWLWEQANWLDIEPYFIKMISNLNGKIYSVEYKTENNRSWAYHVCDTEFMESWLKHPKFHMIK